MLVAQLLEKASEIPQEDATHLPEQYFLVKELAGPWRHLGAEYNWEVGPEVEIKDLCVRVHTKAEWASVNPENIVVFHFSGKECDPWWYIDLPEEQVELVLRARFNWRDSQSRVSLAVAEWVRAVRELLAESSSDVSWQAVHCQMTAAVKHLSANLEVERSRCGGTCEWCKKSTSEAIGTTYGWSECRAWVCSSCILYSQCRSVQPPACPLDFIGRWLNITESGETADSHRIAEVHLHERSLHVSYDNWSGIMVQYPNNQVIIEWNGSYAEDYTCYGWLEGHVIYWRSGQSRWVHVITNPWEEEW
jgi:hypothetical protein